ncbi:MAG: 6-carboxytetrahydropterin synthase [Gemmatimonadota bacterium]|nr:MAG: 6-carboxytetrahydropterin synthase [Gemmatimonadota bacterium]
MAYRCAVRASYDSALFIPGDRGASGRVHGHGYTVEAVLEAPELDDSGFVLDFEEVQAELERIARELDHHLLNDLEPFRDSVPSAERQARFFYERLSKEITARANTGVRLLKIKVTQEPGAWVEYEP